MNREEQYPKRITQNLGSVLESGFVPELGEHKKGKVRDVHISGDKVIMIASDRVSCFDHVLSRCIPFKGVVLNLFNEWAMKYSQDVVPIAAMPSPDPNVIIQRKLKNIGIECVVRRYVWGSLASDYEKGKRVKCGVALPEGLLRYQRLDEPIFTPTSKAETGHDSDLTLDDIAGMHGKERAKEILDISIELFNRGSQLAHNAGMIFIDTKYEFGVDEHGTLYLIDEANTPDSSRFCTEAEYFQKFGEILGRFRTGKFKDVSAMLKAMPDLKIREESKQFVRDVLIDSGYEEGKPLPELTDSQIVETAWRYIASYERLTRKKFDFVASELPTKKRIINNLVKAGLAQGFCVVPIGASTKDEEHWQKIKKALEEEKVPHIHPLYVSAHKETRKVLDFVLGMDRDSIEPLIYLTFAGRSNGLGPVVAGNTDYPVITCPVLSDATYAVDIHSSLRMPSNLPLATIIDPGNAVLFAKRIGRMLK